MSKKKRIDTKHLFHIVCHLNAIPLYDKPASDQKMISQLLFGESGLILEKKNKFWVKVRCSDDHLIGWLKTSQITLIDENIYNKYLTDRTFALEISHPIFNDTLSKTIVMASSLPCYDGISCKIGDEKFVYNGQAGQNIEVNVDLLTKISRRYLGSPELPGGRTPFGIDAAALVQNIMKVFNVQLPRHPHAQFLLGDIVDFVELAKEGDLVFCHNHDLDIDHVGMVIAPKKVLHVYGEVRIDKLDHFGIYHTELKKYVHKLRMIKRLI